MSQLKQVCLILLVLMLVSCSDYQAGYRDGIEGLDKDSWLLFGKTEYLRGFHAGAAEKFQQDWLLENPLNLEGLVCRIPEMKQGELNFIPAGYEPVTNDIFKLTE